MSRGSSLQKSFPYADEAERNSNLVENHQCSRQNFNQGTSKNFPNFEGEDVFDCTIKSGVPQMSMQGGSRMNCNMRVLGTFASCRDLRATEDFRPSNIRVAASDSDSPYDGRNLLEQLARHKSVSTREISQGITRRSSPGYAAAVVTMTMQTPSPSDSGVGELEAVLREKEAELQRLRETMETNEIAIIQVLEEKKQSWEAAMEEKSKEWERKLRAQQQKSFRAEQCLLLQIFKVQQDNKMLHQSVEKMELEKKDLSEELASSVMKMDSLEKKNEELFEELVTMKSHLDSNKQRRSSVDEETLKKLLSEAEEEIRGKYSELTSAMLRLKGSQLEVESKSKELEKLREEVTRLRGSSQGQTHPASPPDEGGRLGSLNTSSSEGSPTAQKSLEDLQTRFDTERLKWLDEKTKVVNYQKQLQLNYLQMTRKNRVLEAEVQQLTSELEKRESELAMNISECSPSQDIKPAVSSSNRTFC